ncbi:HAL/PAL/TAL family ammonia-lyase [Idiomarina xiamenensis]|uniref:tyrosine ammonia-lyase n=1 Tax=Idiomarina xiamenensis 10-D-4 TaxID=740709 RepID=K2KLM0_9GAMM|nr:aromatic amino acid ammonia-lyase [Idiomarina xiamenensis]EKE83419.1 histidine ammonia-lyase [Idiomarina xiamenensis 10-D-4]
MTNQPSITISQQPLTIEQVVAIAKAKASSKLSDDVAFKQQIQRGADFLAKLLADEGVIYGVTTGYGDSVTVPVALDKVHELPVHLTRFHGCGMGEYFDAEQTRAILVARLRSLAHGASGVSWTLLERLQALLDADILPLIPSEGSVGASGDLTPLSYLAGALIGERDVIYQGQQQRSAEVFKALGWTALQLKPKEGLAIMNGTAVMTALACLAWHRAEYLSRLSSRITALVSMALDGNPQHFSEALFKVKPHLGQQQVATWIRDDIAATQHQRSQQRLQDRYSVRCAPHVIGVLRDALPWLRETIENELNSANDNPIIDVEAEQVMHGGHFYGGHIALAMDTLKTAVANIADLHDRQMALLMDTKFNHGLPANLSAAENDRKALNHGFKAVQIGCSAWTAEALKLTMPASVFSRSTECHNQDKVSMGTIAARDCLRILTLTEQVVSASLLAAVQALSLRQQRHQRELTDDVKHFVDDVREQFDLVAEDRPLEAELRYWLSQIQQQRWSLYAKEDMS